MAVRNFNDQRPFIISFPFIEKRRTEIHQFTGHQENPHIGVLYRQLHGSLNFFGLMRHNALDPRQTHSHLRINIVAD